MPSVAPRARLPASVVAAIDHSSRLDIKAGTAPHRFIGIWAVVVDGRVFVRSWSVKPRSWWRTFREDPVGAIQIAERTVRVRAVFTKSERVRDAVDRAYLAKYHSPGAIKYARDLATEKSRATTTELVPARSASSTPGQRTRPRRARTSA